MRRPVAAAFALSAVTLAVPACGFGDPSRVLPGLAHPAASADSGFPIAEGATLHDYNGINLVLPPGWRTDVADNCLAPPRADPSPGGECPHSALRVRPDAARDGFIDEAGADLGDPEQWRRPWASCPKRPDRAGPIRPESAKITERDTFRLVSGEHVEYAEWTVTCTTGDSFRVRAWYVPEADLEFDVPVVREEDADGYAAIVGSADLSRYTAN